MRGSFYGFDSTRYTKHSHVKNDSSEVSISPSNSISSLLFSASSSSSSSSPRAAQVDVELMRTKLIAYFDRVFKPDIKDLIPQTIDTFLLGEYVYFLCLPFCSPSLPPSLPLHFILSFHYFFSASFVNMKLMNE